MKILLITDIHYGSNSNYEKLGSDEYINSFGSMFDKFTSQVQKAISEHDLVINLGDLINETTVEEDIVRYKKANALLDVGVPVYNVAGNHDLNRLSRQQLSEIFGMSKLYYSFDQGGYHHVVLDGSRDEPKQLHRIDPKQLIWLKEDLEETDLPVLIYCHYPVDNQNLDSNYYFRKHPERGFIRNKDEVGEVFENSKKVIAFFNGHLHFHHQEVINNIQYITLPSFSENNGNNQPFAQCLSVRLDGNKVETKMLSFEVEG